MRRRRLTRLSAAAVLCAAVLSGGGLARAGEGEATPVPPPGAEPDRPATFAWFLTLVHADLMTGDCLDAAGMILDLHDSGLVARPPTGKPSTLEHTLFAIVQELRRVPGVDDVLRSRPIGAVFLVGESTESAPAERHTPAQLAAMLREAGGLPAVSHPEAGATTCSEESVAPATAPTPPATSASDTEEPVARSPLPSLSASKDEGGTRKRKWFDTINPVVLIVVSVAAASATGFGIYSIIANR